jgi:hypothetical protein
MQHTDIREIIMFKNKISSTHQAYAAELLVCFDFVSRGFNATVSSFPGCAYDVIVDTGSVPLRVQVKSVFQARAACRRGALKELKNEYRFQLVNKHGESRLKRYIDNEVDLFAFVVLSKQLVLYVETKNLQVTTKSKTFGVKSFDRKASDSLDVFLFNKLFLK